MEAMARERHLEQKNLTGGDERRASSVTCTGGAESVFTQAAAPPAGHMCSLAPDTVGCTYHFRQCSKGPPKPCQVVSLQKTWDKPLPCGVPKCNVSTANARSSGLGRGLRSVGSLG